MNTYWHREKLKALILYLISKTDHKMDWDEVMNKLFYIDCQAMAHTGKSITGSKYIKVKAGAKIKGIETIIREMIHEKSIKMVRA